jgi:hypothetical protein
VLAADLSQISSVQVIGEARRLAAEQPYRERRWELLMLALYRAGRQAESLEVYAEARRLLIDELGLEPGPALRRMQHGVLAQDPELELASQPSAQRGGDFTSAIPGAATRLIGRAVERRELQEVWTRTQLATLVGPPGAGKTRLALDAARQAGHTLDNTDPSALAAARSRYIQVVLTRADGLARRLGSAERGATLRLLDREMPHVRSVLGDVCAPAIAPTLATTALETAVGLSDYWLGRHPAEGLNWLGRLIDTAQPSKKLRAEAQLQRAHLAYWTTEFDAGTAIADEARAEFAALGHRLGEGRALRLPVPMWPAFAGRRPNTRSGPRLPPDSPSPLSWSASRSPSSIPSTLSQIHGIVGASTRDGSPKLTIAQHVDAPRDQVDAAPIVGQSRATDRSCRARGRW